MFCACGCGQRTRLCTYSQPARGYVKGRPLRYINGHNGRGQGSGWYFDPTKNRWYVIGRDGSRTAFYRVVAQNILGRELRVDEDVHHRNGDSSDDRPENLEILAHSDHIRMHYFERERGDGNKLLPLR